MTVLAVVGAQYGSEGKGAVVAKIAGDFDVHIRTGGPNAGHTFFADVPKVEVSAGDGLSGMEQGLAALSRIREQGPVLERRKIVARSVPVGVVNPKAQLFIGPGALFDVDLLIREVRELEELGFSVRSRLLVDSRAIVIDPTRHHGFEGGVAGEAHRLIGSTGEGVGPARMAHVSRGTMAFTNVAWTRVDHAGDLLIQKKLDDAGIGVAANTSSLVTYAIADGLNVLLEGTQGSGLSLTHGRWPYVTSTDTNAAQLLVDAGVSPRLLTDVLLVARTFPIRVAGNSGPLADETTFEEIGVSPEFTTVTRKLRRIGRWDRELFHRAVQLNGPYCRVAVTFADYLFPEVANVDDSGLFPDALHEWLYDLHSLHGVIVDYVGTGPDSVALTERARWGR